MKRPLCYLNLGKGNARSLIEAFAQGSGAEITTKLEFVLGREAVFWGVDRATLPIWKDVIATKTPYWYVDNGYFRSKWQGGDHYRITRNAEQCTGEGTSTGERWRALKMPAIAPWRKSGEHVLVACQSDFWHERHGHGSAAMFGAMVSATLRQHTKRSIVVRGKPIAGHVEPPLTEHFKNCWAVVTYSSIVAAEALLLGIPAFMLCDGAMRTMAKSNLSEIEDPYYPNDRERWAAVLADNQWRLAEIRDGIAWRDLNGR